MKKIFSKLLILTLLSSFVFTSCKDEEDLGAAPRLFRPIVSGSVSGTWIILSWDKYDGTEYYKVQMSEFEDFSVIAEDIQIAESTYTFENLQYNTTYYFKVQAFGSGLQSEPITLSQKTSKLPTKLQSPASNDMIDTQIRVKWDEIDYDRMDVYIGKEFVKSVTISSDENADKTKIITDLTPLTTYTVKVYAGDEYKGEMDYKTVAAQAFEGDYVDLRGLSADEAYSKLTQAYFDELAAQYPNGITVVLEGGMEYEIPTINMSVKTKIVTGLSFLGRAIWRFNGGIGVKPDIYVPSITLEGLIVTDHPSALANSSNFGGKYLLDVRSTTTNNKIDELNIINCDVRYKRGFLRAQSAVEVGKVYIEDCLIDSMGGYGVTNADHNQAYFGQIIVKNSTIAHCEKIFVSTKPSPVDKTSAITVENCTFCYAPKGTGYVFDLNNQNVTGGLTMKNCLFGTGWDTATPNCLRSATTSFTYDKNYRTSDMNWNNAIADVEQITESTEALFAAPGDLNFKITKSDFVNKIGDPRWW